MTSKRLFYVLIALLVVINASGVALLIEGDKRLVAQNSELTQYKVESTALQEVQRSLVRAKKDIETFSNVEKIAKTIVPQEKDQAKTVREIITLADESGVAISSITFPTSNLGAKQAAGAPGTGAASQGAGTTSQTQKVEGLTGVEKLDITVTSDTKQPITYTKMIRFLGLLEQNRRTSQVANITIQPDSTNRNLLTFSLVVTVYIKK